MRMCEEPHYFCSGVVDKVKFLILKDNRHYKGRYKATTNRRCHYKTGAALVLSGRGDARNILKSLEKVGI